MNKDRVSPGTRLRLRQWESNFTYRIQILGREAYINPDDGAVVCPRNTELLFLTLLTQDHG